ncbi:pre-mrna splicing factor rna helicase [Fusarium mundagurra]|uniref:Pre-mrna splicing factor rna helicase n=1 Tax=Fusarium mundagurra TaxID=1567541 RepID=A0A8H6DA08_9HYPO|nr:pre-mrna splicing factor rna helicase [Fusarium mundagurra]
MSFSLFGLLNFLTSWPYGNRHNAVYLFQCRDSQCQRVICLEVYYPGIQYLQLVTAVEPEWLIEDSLFDDDRLPKKFGGELKNPAVKKALDEARSRVQKSSQRV